METRVYGQFELKNHILEVTYPAFEPTTTEYKEYLNTLDTYIDQANDIYIIYDTTLSKYLSADNRIQQSEWIKKRTSDLKTRVRKMIFIIPSLAIRVILKTILAFSPLPCPHEVVKSKSEAYQLIS